MLRDFYDFLRNFEAFRINVYDFIKAFRIFLERHWISVETSSNFQYFFRIFLPASRIFLDVSKNVLEFSKTFLDNSKNSPESSKNF